MPNDHALTKRSFQLLLSWLDPDLDIAAQKYERLRASLIRIFIGRGCYEAEDLADKTIDRVTERVPELLDTYEGDPRLYFYGVARKIFLEWTRTANLKLELGQLPVVDPETVTEEIECLKECLNEIPVELKDLIIEYYETDGPEKIVHRRKIAHGLGITIGALQVRASRIRKDLDNCLTKCMAKKIS